MSFSCPRSRVLLFRAPSRDSRVLCSTPLLRYASRTRYRPKRSPAMCTPPTCGVRRPLADTGRLVGAWPPRPARRPQNTRDRSLPQAVLHGKSFAQTFPQPPSAAPAQSDSPRVLSPPCHRHRDKRNSGGSACHSEGGAPAGDGGRGLPSCGALRGVWRLS